MPNTKGTPRRTVRIPDHLWSKALEVAQANDDDLSAVIRQALERYIQRGTR